MNSIDLDNREQMAEFSRRMKSLEQCDHTTNHAFDVLNAMGLDVENSLEWMRKYGGYCDCEIIYNVILPLEMNQELRADPTFVPDWTIGLSKAELRACGVADDLIAKNLTYWDE